jgi:hypothetical protein
MQHLVGSSTPVLYTGRTVLKGYSIVLSSLRRGVVASINDSAKITFTSEKCDTDLLFSVITYLFHFANP